jgi:malonyl-CoA/methylmalonyl-CoA synthetase
MIQFLDALTRHIQTSPDKVALEFIDPPLQRLTYGQLGERIERGLAYLAAVGLQPGERVALQLPKCLEFIELHLATLYSGGISLPLNPAYPPDEIAYFLMDSGARFFFAEVANAERIEPQLSGLPELERCVFLNLLDTGWSDSQNSSPTRFSGITISNQPNDTAVIIYTSGTTGRSKGAEITHGNLSANLEALHAAWGWQAEDVLLHVLPLFHVHGLIVALHGALHTGARTLLTRQFDAARTLETLVERECSVFMGVPTIHRRLLAVPGAGRFDLSRIRLITSGSDRLPDEVFIDFQRTFGYTLLERYGMTETGMNLSNPLDGERRLGSVGLPLPGVEARVVDPETGQKLPDGHVGELQVRGPNVFKGYWRQPEKTTEAFTPDGWFKTGDLGLREPDGYFTLHGRAKDLIITGGLNVYPPEVEHVLAGHPAVAACAVIGCPDPEWGERVTAAVVLNAGQSVTAEELIAYCRERLAAYKSPRAIFIRQDLPRNAMGKVQKALLREEICS